MIGIYKITNQINGKIYIGQSIHIERRWQEHKQPSANSLIAKAIKKYGVENFVFEVLEELDVTDINKLNQLEANYIQYYNSVTPNGYNVMKESDVIATSFVTFDQNTFYDIVDKIQNTNLTFVEIANMFGLNARTITRINLGQTHWMPELQYPLRKTKQKSQSFCIDCGILITAGCKRCKQCAAKASRFINRPSRDQLKNLIRTKSFVSIGRSFKVSDNAIRKWCEEYGLPKKRAEIKSFTNEQWEEI